MNPFRLRTAAAAIGCAMLAACAAVADPPVRALQVPAGYGHDGRSDGASRRTVAPGATYPARSIAEQAWWKRFGDARLDRLVDRVLAVNPDLASAALALRKARLEAGLARNDLWPQPAASANASASRSLDRRDAVQRSSSASASLSWEVDLWGRLRAARDVAQWEARASEEDRENTALALVGEACEQYWNLAYLNQSIAAGQAHVEQLELVLALVSKQYEAGGVSLLDVRDAEQNLEAQRVSQSTLLQQRAETRSTLAVLLDGEAWPLEDEPQNLDDAEVLSPSPGLPAELLGRRPDLRAAELRLRKALASIQATARSYYPAFTLTGSAGTSSSSLSGILKNPLGTLGAGLTLPFLNLPRMRLDTDIARTDYEIAASDFRGTLYTALKEVDDALRANRQLAVQQAAAQRSFEAAGDVERMYGVRYRTGAADLRTWLDAQQTLRDSELALAQIRRDRLLNAVTLSLALGGDAG